MEGLEALLKGKNRCYLMGFAMLWIILFHYSMYGNLLRYEVVDFLFGKGYLGVDIFFFLSAYGLCFSFSSHSLKEYYSRRLRKLFPLYLVFLAVFLLFFKGNLQDSWIRILLLQSSGLVTFTGMDIEWFIPALILLYAFFPVFFKLFEKLYHAGFLYSALVIVLIAVLSPYASSHIFYLFPPRFTIISVGILTYFAIKDGNGNYLLGIYLVCALLGLCFIGSDKLNVSMTGSLIMPVILYALGQLSVKIPEIKFLDFIGSHTLEIYLAQNLAFNHFMPASTYGFVMTSLIAFAILAAVSVLLNKTQDLFYKLVER